MNEKLKPCPFCGSDDVYIPHIGGRPVGMVACYNCGLICTMGNGNLTEDEIAEKWNRRMTDVPISQHNKKAD